MKLNEFLPSNKSYDKYLLGLILTIGSLLRLYNVPRRWGFDFDASRDALTATLMVENLDIPLLGSLSSATSLNSGPWYYYYLAPFEVLFPIYGSWIFIVFSNIAFVLAMYKIGEVLEGKKFGLLLALLTSIAPSQIILSNTLSNASPIPIFAALAILFFILAVKKKKLLFSFLTGFFVSLGLNTHYQMIGFAIFPAILLLSERNRIRNFTSVTLGFVIPFIPTIIYDLNNNWVNFKGALGFLTSSNDIYYVPNRWLFYLRDFWPGSWSYTTSTPIWLTLLIGGIFSILILIALYKRNLKKEYVLIFAAFAVDVILFRYFPQEKRIYYFYYFYPFVFLFTGYVIYKLYEFKKLRSIAIGLLLLLVSFMIKSDTKVLNSNEYHLQVNQQKNILVSKYPNAVFNIYSCNENFDRGMGLTYLLHVEEKSSREGRKIGLANGSCGNHEGFKAIENATLFELTGDDKDLSVKNWHSISNKSMEEIKNMQLYRSY